MRINNLCIICISTVLILLNSTVVAQENMIQQPCYTIGTVENGLTGTAFNYAHVVGSATKSFGVGDGVYVWSPYSVSLGQNNSIAYHSENSLAFGKDNQILEYTPNSIAIGSNNIIRKISPNTTEYSTLIGHDNYAKNEYVIGIGTGNTLNGANSAAFGNKIETGGNADYSIGIGYMANVADPYSIAIGSNSEIPAIYVKGSSDPQVIGHVGIGTKTPRSMLDIAGSIYVSGADNTIFFDSDESDYAANWAVDYQTNKGLRFYEPIYGNVGPGGGGTTGDAPTSYEVVSRKTHLFIQNNSGNIGAGATRPIQKLHINGNLLVNTVGASLLFDDEAGPENPNGRWGIKYESSGLNFWKPIRSLEAAPGEVELNYALFISDEEGKIGLNTSYPCERLQIGDRWTFHDGGNKIIGYNWDWLSVEGSGYSRRILDGKSCWMSMSETGDIEFSSAPEGVAGESFENQKHSNIWIGNNGNVGIGLDGYSDYNILRNSTSSKLWVKGGITTTEVWVKLAVDWSDFVFDKDYHLRPLSEVESFIKENGHLPEIPNAAEVAEKGINVGEMDAKLLQKIEELTLYVIEQQKQIDELKKQLNNQKHEDQ